MMLLQNNVTKDIIGDDEKGKDSILNNNDIEDTII